MKILSLTLLMLILSGCYQTDTKKSTTPQVQNIKIDQSNICIFSSDEEAKMCKTGQLAWFRPSQWGNEQLPLNVAGLYCDFNHQVMNNNSGVICVFTNERLFLLDSEQ